MSEYLTFGIDAIGTFGFPIFMCIWFMTRTEKFMMKVTNALTGLRDEVIKL